MDSHSCLRDGEHDPRAPPVPRPESLLTGHVSQQLRVPPVPASPSASVPDPPLSWSPSQSLPSSPVNFDFPTLNLDGSLPDLRPVQPARRHPPTPPAALSSLGARAKMANQHDFGSESELTDSQYDMIDDLSEISTDDHDTASIASNCDDEQLPLGDGTSEVDADEAIPFLDDHPVYHPLSPTEAVVGSPVQQSDILESYTSEDLETPRQSSMPIAFSSTYLQSFANGTNAQRRAEEDVKHHILFVSDQAVPQHLMDTICTKVAACLEHTRLTDSLEHKIVRLPSTPSGISLQSATVVYGDDGIIASVRHCVDAEIRSKDTFKLRVMDADKEHSSYYTIGTDVKVDLAGADVAVFYLDDKADNMSWLSTAVMAVERLSVPTLFIHHPSLSTGSPSPALRSIFRKSQKSSVIRSDKFLAMSRPDLSVHVQKLLNGKSTTSGKLGRGMTKTPTYGRILWLVFKLFILASPLLYLSFLPGLLSSKGDAAFNLAARRSNLIEAMSQATNSTHVTKDVDIDHLLGPLLGSCPDERCKPTPHYQAVQPNHVIISLPAQPRFPEVTMTNVKKADGRAISFSQSELVEGVYIITIDPDEAYGVVTVNMLTRKPYLNVTAPHNYGNRMLQRKTYEKAGTEVSKAVGKDIVVMRDVAKALTDRLSTELGAGVWATQNITTQLALYVARDLQLFSDSAIAFLGKAANVGNQTASKLNKELVLARRDVARFSKDLSTMVQSKVAQAKSSSKQFIRTPLSTSRQRARVLKKSLRRNKQAAKWAIKNKVAEIKLRLRSDNRKPCIRYAIQAGEGKAASDESKHMQAMKAKREARKLARKLDAISNSIEKQLDEDGRKLTKRELRQLKKEAKEQRKALKRMEAKIEQNARV